MVISFKGDSAKWLWFRPWPLHQLIQQYGAPDQLNNVTLILDCTVSPNKIFCSTFFKTLWVHEVYLILLEYMSKIVQCHRLVGVFIKLRRVWLWAELCSPPREHYIKPEPEAKLGASRLQRLFMRPWLSNVKAMTLLSIVLWRPPVSLILSLSMFLLFRLFSFYTLTAHLMLNSILIKSCLLFCRIIGSWGSEIWRWFKGLIYIGVIQSLRMHRILETDSHSFLKF